MSSKGLISRMSDECLITLETVVSFYTQYQAVMRKFTLAGKAICFICNVMITLSKFLNRHKSFLFLRSKIWCSMASSSFVDLLPFSLFFLLISLSRSDCENILFTVSFPKISCVATKTSTDHTENTDV